MKYLFNPLDMSEDEDPVSRLVIDIPAIAILHADREKATKERKVGINIAIAALYQYQFFLCWKLFSRRDRIAGMSWD